MKNEHKVMGEYTIIYINSKSEVHECLVDTEDIPLLDAITHRKWCLDKKGYAVAWVTDGSRKVSMHRTIMREPEDLVVDHLSGILDNRKRYLRAVTQQVNSLNKRGSRRGSKSGIRGVCWSKNAGLWHAQLGVRGVPVHLGYYKDKSEAGRAVSKYLMNIDPCSVTRVPIVLNVGE